MSKVSDNQKNSSKYGIESVNSQILKNNLQDFFNNSKEKLSKLKGEIEEWKTENRAQEQENKALELRCKELSEYNAELDLRIKGMKQKLIEANKEKTSIQNKTRDIRKEIDQVNKDIDSRKIDNQFKVKIVQNEIDHMNVVKENNIKSLRMKIQSEQEYQDELIRQMNDYRNEIKRYKKLLSQTDSEENERNKAIIKEASDMEKFLSNI